MNYIPYINRKVGTAVLSSLAAFHTVFRVDYGDREHVFTGLQKWYNQTVDDILLGKRGNENGNGNGSNGEKSGVNEVQNPNLVANHADLQNQLKSMNNATSASNGDVKR